MNTQYQGYPNGKPPKTVRTSTIVLAASLAVAAALLIAFVLLFIFKDELKLGAESFKKLFAAATEQPTVTTVTEAPTEAPKPTEQSKKAKDKAKEDAFESYLVWLDEGVIINASPDSSSEVTYVIDQATKYTIVDESYDKNGDKWGKLKSGVGWVNLSKMPKESKKSSDSFESYLVWLDAGVQVHASPDSSSAVTYTIDVSTKYTIVEEAYDQNGDKWGKLKSGVGWVELS